MNLCNDVEYVGLAEAARILGTYPMGVYKIAVTNGVRVKVLASAPPRFNREDLGSLASQSVRQAVRA